MRKLIYCSLVFILVSCSTSRKSTVDCVSCAEFRTTEYSDKPILTMIREYSNHEEWSLEELNLAVFPIRFLILENEERKSNVTVEMVERTLSELNIAFSKARIRFEMVVVEALPSPAVMEDFNHGSLAYYDFCDLDEKHFPNTLSVYIMNNKEELCEFTPTTKRCSRVDGLSNIAQEGPNNIVVSNFAFNNMKTIVHEMGHFFGLRHTFDTSSGLEKADGSNCEIAGDLLCDTPADPDEMFYINFGTCEMVGNFDLDGNEYKPLVNNYMNYYYPCHMERFEFTNQQSFVMNQVAHSFIKNKLQKKPALGL